MKLELRCLYNTILVIMYSADVQLQKAIISAAGLIAAKHKKIEN